MTHYELWSLIVQAVGFATVAISLVFVAKQTRIIAHALKDSSLEHTMARVFDISKIFIDTPQLLPYFYDGVQVSEESTDRDAARATAVFILDVFDYFILNRRMLDALCNDSYERWEIWITDMFGNSPILRQVYEHRRSWYPPELQALYQKAVSRLQK